MNTIQLLGRLVADPEVKSVKCGKEKKKVVNFTIACDAGKDNTDFIQCAAWEGRAEFIGKYFEKGQRIAVTGTLKQENWEDEDGNKRTNYRVLVNSVDFCEKSED